MSLRILGEPFKLCAIINLGLNAYEPPKPTIVSGFPILTAAAELTPPLRG